MEWAYNNNASFAIYCADFLEIYNRGTVTDQPFTNARPTWRDNEGKCLMSLPCFTMLTGAPLVEITWTWLITNFFFWRLGHPALMPFCLAEQFKKHTQHCDFTFSLATSSGSAVIFSKFENLSFETKDRTPALCCAVNPAGMDGPAASSYTRTTARTVQHQSLFAKGCMATRSPPILIRERTSCSTLVAVK